MKSPYQDRPSRTFWRTGVADNPDALLDIYSPKFQLKPEDSIATAGSCFAQHISRHLQAARFNVLNVEPGPARMSGELATKYGYGIYSARYGNLYTARQLLQLILEARGKFHPQDWIWQKDNRYFDALRPSVEPKGLASQDEVIAHRQQHLIAVRRMLKRADVLIFTFGLTEAWIHRGSGTVYATAPGTIAGNYDPAVHEFKNFTFNEIYRDFAKLREVLKRRKPDMRFLLTVSPVPLTATATDDHVLAATIYSKSVLRSVAGQLRSDFEDVDYFPSYEIIAGHPSKGKHYESNLREVSSAGVSKAMSIFMRSTLNETAAIQTAAAKKQRRKARRRNRNKSQDVVCEEMLLDAFRPSDRAASVIP